MGMEPDEAALIAEAMCINSTITKLRIADNHVGDRGAFQFAKMIAENRALEHLDLQCTDISNDGARAIARALAENTTLLTLNLTANARIGVDGGEALLAAIQAKE